MSKSVFGFAAIAGRALSVAAMALTLAHTMSAPAFAGLSGEAAKGKEILFVVFEHADMSRHAHYEAVAGNTCQAKLDQLKIDGKLNFDTSATPNEVPARILQAACILAKGQIVKTPEKAGGGGRGGLTSIL